MQRIYLAKPGAQKEGPFTLEQINHDLARNKIKDTDFWAWHEGLPTWMPLYSVPGVSAKAWVVNALEAKSEGESQTGAAVSSSRPEVSGTETNGKSTFKPAAKPARVAPKPMAASAPSPKTNHKAVSASAPQPEAAKENVAPDPVAKRSSDLLEQSQAEAAAAHVAQPEPGLQVLQPVRADSPEATDASNGDPKPKPTELLATPSLSSGKPFAALDHVFIFTTGEGPAALKSEVTASMLAEAVDHKVEDLWENVPVDVVGGTAAGVVEAIRSGSIPGSAWRALFRIKRTVAQQIQDGWYHLCVRTFRLESNDLVAAFLLYNKHKL
jgi:hypothetical protein